MIEVFFGDEHGQEAPFVFKPPTMESLVASANRLLKFQFPVLRHLQVYERLIKNHLVSARLSKKTIENLPFPQVELIYRTLWQELLPLTRETENQWLALYLMAEETLEFQLNEIVSQDIQLLGVADTGPGQLHSYYYQGAPERDNLATLLQNNRYRTDFLSLSESAGLPQSYLLCRRLSHPLPWAELLESLDDDARERHPRLKRLDAIRQALAGKPWTQSPVTPENFPTAHENLRAFLQTDVPEISARTQVPRPSRILLIVEGETEKLLLPIFGKAMGLDFARLGVDLIPAGGKNQVMALYRDFSQVLNIPVFIILDEDATATVNDLKPILRDIDCIYQLQEGEFEDLYDLDLVLKTINRHYQPHPAVNRATFEDADIVHGAKGRVQALKAIWQSYNLGSFDKTGFAQKLVETTPPGTQPPEAIRALLQAIMETREP